MNYQLVSKMNTWIKRSSIALAIGALPLAGLWWYMQTKNNTPFTTHAEDEEDADEADPNDTLISFIAVGDMMLGTNFPGPEHLPANKGNILLPVEHYLQDADVTFGNLEGTVLNEGGDVKSCSDPKTCYAFRQPEYVVDFLKQAGFDMVSVANNHMGDFGAPGRTNTQKVLKEKGIKYAGLETCPTDTFHVKGLVIGLAAFAPNGGCVRLTDHAKVKEIVAGLDKICDIVIVSFHGGAEGSSKQHVTRQTEIFLGEDRGNVYKFSRDVIDAGADLVLGHGPHVTRAIDSYKGKFITYSMGNFATYSRFNLSGPNGIAPIYKLYYTRKGEFVKGEVISIQQLGNGGPTLDPAMRVLKVIQDLTTTDFPETKWSFDEKGNFTLAK